MLFVLFISVLCSVAACTHWLVSVAIGLTMTIGGIAGRIVAGTRSGFIEGAVVGISFSVIAVEVGMLLPLAYSYSREPSWLLWWAVISIAALVGGVLGGFEDRRASER
jgi:uncharacterized membrane protein